MTRGDRIIWKIIAVALLISLAGTLLYSRQNRSGAVALITCDGDIIKTIDLHSQTSAEEWTINLPGGGFNTVRTEPGKIRFVSSDCPKQICVSTGWLDSPGDIAVCLPHRLMISVEGKEKRGGIDALSR